VTDCCSQRASERQLRTLD